MAVSAMTLIYRTAVISSTKASNSVQLHGNVSLIIQSIQSKIRGSNSTIPLNGQGTIDDVEYTWTSTLNMASGAPLRFDPSEGQWVEQPDKFYLWTVKLSLQSKTLKKVFYFKEISWQQL